ncbi:MAG: hypothetical protein ACR2GY_09175 [Phycisphaerales bacterium]
MKCQTCDIEMIEGTLKSKTSFFSTAAPASYDDQKWYFVDYAGRKKKLEESMHDRSAHRCFSCGLIVIPGKDTK